MQGSDRQFSAVVHYLHSRKLFVELHNARTNVKTDLMDEGMAGAVILLPDRFHYCLSIQFAADCREQQQADIIQRPFGIHISYSFDILLFYDPVFCRYSALQRTSYDSLLLSFRMKSIKGIFRFKPFMH